MKQVEQILSFKGSAQRFSEMYRGLGADPIMVGQLPGIDKLKCEPRAWHDSSTLKPLAKIIKGGNKC